MRLAAHNAARIWGGNEKWLWTTCTGLRDRGHEVLLSCVPGAPLYECARASGLRTTAARPGGDLDVFSALRFAWTLRRFGPDALLLTSHQKAYWAGWAARRAGVGRVVLRLGIERDYPVRTRPLHAVRDYVDALVVNSRVIEERWVRTGPVPLPHEVHVVLNGVQYVEPLDEDLRDTLGIPPAAPVAATVGRLETRKGVDHVIDAMSGREHAHLLIVGDGPDEAALRARASSSPIAPRVHFLGFRSDAAALLGQCDLLVLASDSEGMANVVLEAMSTGCTVVSTEVSGAHEALDPREGGAAAGFVVPRDDLSALSAAITRVLDERGSAADAERRAEAQRRASEEFSVERMLDEVERVLFPVQDMERG